MNEDVSYVEEFETIFELIMSVMFMAFCVFATAYFMANVTPRIRISYDNDKITSLSTVYAEDPNYLNAYQAYMLAWHMDTISEEQLMYLTDTTKVHQPSAYNHGNDTETDDCANAEDHVILSSAFTNWRSRYVTGATLPTGKPYVASILNTVRGSDSARDFWSGISSKKFYLEHTYTNMGNRTSSDGKEAIWQLTPVIH